MGSDMILYFSCLNTSVQNLKLYITDISQGTSAELSPEKKNELSHRGEGLRKMRGIIRELESGKR